MNTAAATAIEKLEQLRARHQSVVRQTRVWRAAAVWAALAAGAVAADVGWSVLGAIGERDAYAVHELPGWVRLVMLVMLAAGAVIVAMRWRLPPEVRKRGLRDYARSVERATEMGSNDLVSVVGMSGVSGTAKPQAADELRAELVERVVERADRRARDVDWEAMVDRRAERMARRQFGWACAMWVVLAVGVWAVIGGWTTEVLRMVDPLGDHPPAAAARLDLHDATVSSDGVKLRLDVRGTPADEARLRLKDGTTLAMQKDADGTFTAVLHQVRGPIEVRAEAANARTAWMTVSAKLPGGQAVALTGNQGKEDDVDASANNAQGHTGNGGNNGTGTGQGDEPAPDQMTAAVGELLEQVESPQRRNEIARLVEQAPAEYREQVARYLMEKLQ